MLWFIALLINALYCGYYLVELRRKEPEKWHLIYPLLTVLLTAAWVMFSINIVHAVMMAIVFGLAYFTYRLYRRLWPC